MLRLAGMYVSSRAVAEEVVQETWLAVLTGIDRFEERSSLKTWIFRILTNKAKTRAEREGRTVPFSSLGNPDGDDEPAVDPDRFLDTGVPGRGPVGDAAAGARPRPRGAAARARGAGADRRCDRRAARLPSAR